MFNHSQKIISLVLAVPLLLTVSVTESKAAINKTTIESTSSHAIASSCSQKKPLSEENFITRDRESLTSSVTPTETSTKNTKIISRQSSQELQFTIAARPDQQTDKCRVLGDC
jgi:hypothetical protein